MAENESLLSIPRMRVVINFHLNSLPHFPPQKESRLFWTETPNGEPACTQNNVSGSEPWRIPCRNYLCPHVTCEKSLYGILQFSWTASMSVQTHADNIYLCSRGWGGGGNGQIQYQSCAPPPTPALPLTKWPVSSLSDTSHLSQLWGLPRIRLRG